jgi:CBS domain containing-hemolysin-like protein
VSAVTLAAEVGLEVPTGVALVLAALLLAANAFFVATEIALLAARRASIDERAEAGEWRARTAARVLRELPITFSGAQLGITMASLGLGAVVEPSVARVLERALGIAPLSPSARHVVAVVIALSIVVFLHMVLGEMVPKNLALARPERLVLRLVPVFRAFVFVLRPLIVALNASANLLVRLVGVEPREELSLVHTSDELALTVRESRREGVLPDQEARVLTGVLGLARIDAEAAMTPRVDIRAVPDDAAATDVLGIARESGLTRLPVYHGDLDVIVGIVHVKDVLTLGVDDLRDARVADVLRPITAVPESRDLERILRDMRRERSHAVLVVDEFGGTAGVITLEDVLEEVVGEIEDEFDPAAHHVRQLGGSRWMVPGLLRPDELAAHTGLVLPEGDYETVSGYLTEQLGRLVEPGDEVEHGGWRLVVRTIEGRRAGDVEVIGPPAPDEGEP